VRCQTVARTGSASGGSFGMGGVATRSRGHDEGFGMGEEGGLGPGRKGERAQGGRKEMGSTMMNSVEFD
jgi:hypothetical protein